MTEPAADQSQPTPPTPMGPPVRPVDHGPRSNSPLWVAVAAAVALALGAGAILTALPGSFTVNVTSPNANTTGVTVSGTSTIHAVPDMATVNFGISSTATTIRLARAQTAAAATRVIAALRSAGVAETDISTTNVSLYQNNPYPYTDPNSPCYLKGGIMVPASPPVPEPMPAVTPGVAPDLPTASALPVASGSPTDNNPSSGTVGAPSSGLALNGGLVTPPTPVSSNNPITVNTFGATSGSGSSSSGSGAAVPGAPSVISSGPTPITPINLNCAPSWVYSESLHVTINDLDIASDVIDGAVKAGATSVDSLSFDVSNRSTLESQARTQAITDARTQAAAMAKAAGGTLGNPVSINASFSGPIYMAKDMAIGAAAPSTATPVSPGTMDITAQVTVIFDFKQ